MSRSQDETRAFLLAYVGTFEALEVLLAMHAAPERSLTPDATASQLGLSVDEVRMALESLSAHGFCAKASDSTGPAYRYDPPHALRDGARDVAEVRLHSPGTLASLMSANAIERMRMLVARSFADAFVILVAIADKNRRA